MNLPEFTAHAIYDNFFNIDSKPRKIIVTLLSCEILLIRIIFRAFIHISSLTLADRVQKTLNSLVTFRRINFIITEILFDSI